MEEGGFGGPGFGGRHWGQEQVFLSLTRHTWTDIHRYLALVLIALVLVHIYLHWSWIVAMTRQLFASKGE
ncbi:DUF4405 domain-containing protein [Desulfothermobacter acidiphilus]|uniref:DUF4405 domain-containing protein n=1 Tax=Desulfothermobacter acidiphilus TaxID=1938353 RepID=UPI003F89E413